MDIGKNIQLSFNLYFKNFVVLVLASLVVMVLSGVTFGILAGPLFAGLIMLCLKLLRGQPAEFNEIFAYFNKFVPTLLVVLMMVAAGIVLFVINSIPVLGFLISLVVWPALGFIFFMALGLIADKGLEPIPAVKQGLEYFLSNPVMNWLYVFILGLIAGIAAGIPLAIITMILSFAPALALVLVPLFGFALSALVYPFVTLGMAAAYQELTAKPPAAGLKLDPQTLKIIGIVVAALFVIGLIFMIFFAGRISPFGISRSGLGRFGPGGNENFTYRTKEGTIQAGIGIPQNFPKDIPLYPGAKPSGSWSGSSGSSLTAAVTLSTNDTPDQVNQFYLAKMPAKGWQVQSGQYGTINVLNCTKENRKADFTITPDGNRTNIAVTYSNE